jgi:hypothetical protein
VHVFLERERLSRELLCVRPAIQLSKILEYRRDTCAGILQKNTTYLTLLGEPVQMNLMFYWPCIIVYQYNETNVMHFLFNLLRIKDLTCFKHYLFILRRRYTSGTWYVACVLCQLAAPGLKWNCAANWHNTHAIYQVPLV